jgi:hypothetical protein
LCPVQNCPQKRGEGMLMSYLSTNDKGFV